MVSTKMRLPEHLTLLYEPLVDLKSRKAVAVQAGLRWSSRFEQEDPESFEAVSHWRFAHHRPEVDLPLIQVVCEHMRDWAETGTLVRVCVPVDAGTLGHPKLLSTLLYAAQQTGVPIEQLELGLTPESAIVDMQAASRNIEALSKHGVKLALLGFGAGHLSLACLSRLRCERVEVTEQWVVDLGPSVGTYQILRSCFDIFSSFGKQTAAAGADSEEQVRLLAQVGCQLARGLAFSAPVIPLVVPAALAALQ